VVEQAAQEWPQSDAKAAGALLRSHYPHRPVLATPRRPRLDSSIRIFLRDGFVDRYSGRRLVNPGVLRLLSLLFPDEMPFHPSWKLSATHIAFWELFPTLDHRLPVTRDGAAGEANLVCTSILANQAKAHWTLEELE